MKDRKVLFGIAVLMAAMVVLAGCGSSAPAPAAATTQAPVAEAASPAPALEVATPGAAVPDELDAAIREAADYLNKSLPQGSKLVILNIKSSYPPLSEYIIDTLTGDVVNDRKFTVVDRANLELIKQEMDFQYSGEVSDQSAQSIGQKLGAQTIISGSATAFGALWRISVRALDVQSAEVRGQFNRNIPNGMTIAALTSGPAGTAGAASGGAAASAGAGSGAKAAAAPEPAAYKIGDKGPAGGIVFYDKGKESDGWRYMECASDDVGKTKWSGNNQGFNLVGGTKTEIGTGKRNTDIIARFMQGQGETKTPAQLCKNYDQGGFNDWFMPSKDELNQMYRNLEAKGLVTFPGANYWSSSEISRNTVWVQRFSDGEQDGGGAHAGIESNGKGWHEFSVRPIRQF
jgi:TolB-like protein